jgi:transposase
VDVPGFLGGDGAKAPLDIAVRPSGERWAVPNDAAGVATLVAPGQALHPTLMVLAAPGGLERVAPAALATGGLPVGGVTPRQARDFARATGPWAKTEAREARALAHLADVSRPTPRPLPAAQPQELRALCGRRQPLMVGRPAEQHRLAGPSGRLQPDSEAPSTWLNERLATLANAIETLRRASPWWREHEALVPRAPGLGPVCARTLRRALPELGPLKRRPSAAWVGVAPRNGASGPLRGRRMMGGGRAPGRTVLDRGTRVATRYHPRSKALYERLRAAGKVNKVALTACMPKFLPILNALLQPRTPWQAPEVQG